MTFDNPYGPLDRLLHRTAMAGTRAQIALADVEDLFYASRLRDIEITRPVFVTSLPRAGTTLLLKVHAELPEFASHTYRDMPFLLCPLLWDRIARAFHRRAQPRERTHGDGVLVDYDSPEAFEEVVWKAFFPKHYRGASIEPWDRDEETDEFAEFFRAHIRKVLALRDIPYGSSAVPRYVSKNNANIARIRLLSRLFPDCVILVPIREPGSHVASMLRQHERFTAIHADDEFARFYMESIGHMEFGAALRPINFGGWRSGEDLAATHTPDFWLRYWIHAFEEVLATRTENVVVVSYERCCQDPPAAMRALAEALTPNDPERLLAQASRYRAPTAHDARSIDASEDSVSRAEDVYEALLSLSIT